MEAHAASFDQPVAYPAAVDVRPATEQRNRLTTVFRFFLSLPHLILVGGPVAVITSVGWNLDNGLNVGWGSGGVLGFLLCFLLVYAWFALLLTGRHPQRVRELTESYMRWRVRAIAYMTLLRDEYPPFGEGDYPVTLTLPEPADERNRLTILLRLLFALPHVFLLWLLGIAWGIATAVAWVMILVTGRYPETLYGFALGVLAWSVRVEAYMLLLTDEYPPFTLRA
jgi:hypothetical protein